MTREEAIKMLNRVIEDMIIILYILIVPMWIIELLEIDTYLISRKWE